MKKLLFLIILVVAGYFGYQYFIKNGENGIINLKPKFVYEDLLKNTSDNLVNVDTFTIYGKYLNIKGVCPTNDGNYTLVFKNNDEEINIKTETEVNTYNLANNQDETNIPNQKFYTNKYINDGINLEKLKVGEYIIMLKNLNTNTYYNLLNNTTYHNNTYYTMSKNNQNNVITFKEEAHDNKKYWVISIQETKLPDDVYDVVIDAGHGGVDTGASNGRYHESKFTLEYALALKEALEEEGLKVKLTRETDTKIDHYGEGSRTGIPYEVKAKLMLSIHLNSSNSKNQKGVEIYKAYYDNDNYAKLLADNIVNEVGTVYSNNPMHKVMDGVYMRVYSKADIKSLANDAKRDGYTPYDFGDDVTYYYFVRETGGIMTKAFSDGRNPKYKANPYRNLNQGVEAYLCELAYISQSDDLKLVLNKKDSFVKALKTSVFSYVNN